ncbi:flagellar basal-body MS-ring/collar protein FliF [Alkalimarinus sediminis]|uniref:Flagellar M-ring protein n=1 Tax=Alkalimarinus sediminis TaxID=1632866 RepID=A0A9E8KRT3_9ALTE|nr:flagellar basal-body MS-ring/collar protein FliF [Alkalimarinus sediminis]UZW76760.1 flagellar M-ring protein FliF [Alkalimarinus sediminis]
MANVPAETNNNVPATTGSEAPGSMMPSEPDNEMFMGFNKLNLMRQVGLMIGLAASVALGLSVVLWAQEPNYQPIMSNINNMDINEVSTLLSQNDITYKIDPSSGVLLVESSEVHRAKLKLAAAGITEQAPAGFELLDQEQGLGTSQFMESTRFKRGLEGELSKTISSLRNVRSARVHLAIPKRSVFVRDVRKPTASVFVEVFSGRPLAKGQVDSIVNLVAGSVPEMNKEDVTVVDQKGNLLSQTDESSEDRLASREFEYSRKMEKVLNGRVSSILEPILGSGRFRSEVSTEIDFTSVEQAEEIFNPDMQAIRSEQTLDEQRVAGNQGGIPGALANQPPGAANVPEVAGGEGAGAEGGVSDLRKQTTRNYEVDRTVSYTKQQPGRIKRLTVAVAIDDIRKVDPETGEVSFAPWTENELQRLTLLVRNAVGYSASRGDSVNVINTPFAPEEIVPFEETPIWQQQWLLDFVKPIMAGIVILILVLGLVRPTLKSLAQSGQQAKELALAGDEDGLAELDQLGEASPDGKVTLSSTDEFLLPGASEGYDKQLNALKGLVVEDPARVAQVVRQWVNADD